MWKPYFKVIAKKAGQAIHVLDRFHIMAHLNKAIDKVRAEEATALKTKGYEPILTQTRWLLLKRPENLSEPQNLKLADLLRSKIEPMKKVARMLKKHRSLLLNWFRAKGQFSSGVVEGFNTKAKLTTRKAYGFRTYHGAEIAWYHTLGALPVPESAHRFC